VKTPLYLEYTRPAPDYADFFRARVDDRPDAGWEKWSLPLGNSRFGASLFGRTETDRIQITENSVANPLLRGTSWKLGNGGTRSFGDLIFEFGHRSPIKYKRSLSLDNAVSTVTYEHSGVKYEREYFLSYPDNVLAMRFRANKGGKISFVLSPMISFCGDHCVAENDGCGRSGEVFSSHQDIVMSGTSNYYNIKYEGRVRVRAYGGRLFNDNGILKLKNADSAEIYFTCGTNYRMEDRVFTETDPKKKLEPYGQCGKNVLETLNAAYKKGYDELKKNHIRDHSALFGRVQLSLGGKYRGIPTNDLLEAYKRGEESRYLEELVFQYGRYLLIASSRRGGYPANLQGTWCAYDSAPWGCDYHHNINVQMNYWPAHIANLAECFAAYSDYAAAYMPRARQNAERYIKQNLPERFPGEGKCGWTIGTSASLYTISTPQANGHSGPGTGAFTSLLFWQHYDFTRDKKYLQETAYPYLLEMSRFLLLLLTEEDGKLLAENSASPEQLHGGKYYVTKGCAFDQQMIHENFSKTLLAAKALSVTAKEEPLLEEIEKALPLLDPVKIGIGRYIKEYREEEFYSQIGEEKHRHISQLVALYPGAIISRKTPDWLDAAKNTLNLRGDKSTGWAAAHRLCLWARTGDEEHAHKIYREFIKNNILPNLWSTHPPFQIDGNLGVTAGVAEMLIQSHTDAIELLPSLPEPWRNGSFEGLCTRGGFVIDCTWENRQITFIRVKSTVGGVCRLRFRGANRAALDNIEFSVDGNLMFFSTIAGESIDITIE
jgi:hypothetical protein